MKECQLEANASWDQYVERLEMYCEANSVATTEQKRSILLSCCGEEMYSLIVTLVKPTRPTGADYRVIVKAVKTHMHPRRSEL